MKRINLITAICVTTILFITSNSFAQLSGNYTINPKNAASTTNYQNWASAVGDLLSGSRTDGGTANGAGVTGPVVFTVYDTLYSNTQITLTAITGASYTNTITFKSTSDSSKCVLEYPSGTATTDDWVVKIDGADYITFQKIGFTRTGSNAYYTVIQMMNDADRNSFKNCWMKTRKVPSTTSGGWTTGVGALIYISSNADSTLISQNRMIYGYNSIYGPTTCTGTMVYNNVFDTLGCIGVYMSSQTGLKVIGNTFNMGDFGTGTGHYVSYASRIESSSAIEISKNKIFLKAVNGQVLRALVFVYVNASAASPSLVYNNFIVNYGGTSSASGISLYGVQYMEICYNNILITSSMAAGSVIHENTGYVQTNTRIKNNNFINTGGGMVYDLQTPSSLGGNTGIDTVINNNCYTTGSVFGKWTGGVSYSSLSAWQSGTGADINSINVNPGFVSNSDLHVSNIGINKKATPYWRVSTDIDGDTRDATQPDIGADEFFPVANDAGISSLDSPSVFCASTKNIKITFQNYGADTLKSLTINWKINGTSQTAYNWTGSIPPGSSSSSITLGSYAFAANTPYVFKIWGSSPNSGTDGNNTNDTLNVTRYAGMTGTYTIGSTGDFQSINNAVTAMTQRGICGAITFNIANGTYTEQLTLPLLTGMGASNPITFQSASGDSSQVIISLPSSTATGTNNAIVQLNGGDYITFKKITFLRTGTNATALVIHILNGSDHNTFTNCQMIGTNYASTSAYNIWSDQGTDNYNTFKNNYVKLGYVSMLYQGLSTGYEYGTVVEGNVFDSAYYSAVQIGYQIDVSFKNNVFRNSRFTSTGSYDVQLLECDSSTRVIGNYFFNPNTDVAIHLTGCNAPNSTNPGIIANNMIAKPSVTGILLDAVTNQFVVFNNINLTGTGTSNAGISTTSNTSTGIVLKNNNIKMAGGNLLYISTASQISASNRNNLWSRSSQFASWGGTSYSNLNNLKAATSKDANSMSVDPYFVSNTDLHVKNTALKSAGEVISGVTTDVDGQTRNTSTPDIGADEFALQAYDAAIVGVTAPSSVICEGVQAVKVTFKNFGTTTLTSATINWTVNGVSQTPKSWTGSVASLGTDEVNLGNYNFTGNVTLPVVINSISPNGFTDGFQYNDTFRTSIQVKTRPAVNAGADKNLCINDSVLIGPASSTGYSYKWMTMSSTVIGTTSQIYVKPTTNTSYVLEITDNAAGCSNTDTILINVRTKPTSGFTVNNNSQCLTGNSFVFTNTSTGASTYAWNFGDATTSTNPSPTKNYTAAGTFNVKLVAITTYGCKDSTTSAVNVRPQAATAFSVPDTSLCFRGNSFVFTNNSTISTGTFTNSWSFGDNTTSTASAPTKSYTAVGTYSVKLVTTSNYNCKDSITKNLYVRTHPVTGFSINDTSQCLRGNSFVFTNNSTIGSGTFADNWNFGDNTTSTVSAPTKTYSTIGTYSVKLVTVSNYGCKDSLSKQVIVNPHPLTGFMVNSISQCLRGNSFALSNLSSGNSSNLWNFGDNTTSTTPSPSKTYQTEGTFDIKLVTTSNMGCKDSTSRSVDVRPHPVSSFTINVLGQCLTGNSFDFTNNTTIKTGTFTDFWSFGDNTTSTVSSPSKSYLNSGIYIVKLVATSDFGCKDSTSQTSTVYPQPVVSYVLSNNTQCLKSNLFNFDNTSTIGSGTMTALWNFGDGDTTTTFDPSHSYLNAGTFDVMLYITSDKGCVDSLKGNVEVYPQPQAYFIINDMGHCLKNNNFGFTDNTIITGDTINIWNWTFGDGNADNKQNTGHSYTSLGTYDVKLAVTSSKGCMDSVTKSVSVYPEPVASFIINDSTQCKNGNQFQFTSTSTIPYGTKNYHWDLGDGATNTDSILAHSYASATNYTVWLKVLSDMNCADSISHKVYITANPVVNLGADDTIENAESINLDAGSGFDAYLWKPNNETTSQITVDSTKYGTGVKTISVRVTKDGCYGFDTVVITIIKTTSIVDPESDYQMKVYPNPVVSLLNIDLSPIRKEMVITLTDMNGKQLKSMRIKPDNSPSVHQIDLSGFAKGMYYLNVSNSGGNKVTKIVKF